MFRNGQIIIADNGDILWNASPRLTDGVHGGNGHKITVDEEGMPTQGMGEVIIAKHRNGSTGSVKLKFIGSV